MTAGCKSALLNEYNKEEVYVEQSHGLEVEKAPNHMYKLHTSSHWSEATSKGMVRNVGSFLVTQGFERGKVDTTLLTKG